MMTTKGFAVIVIGVTMMTLMWTDVTESKIICPTDDTTLPSYKDMGFVKPVPNFATLRAWLIHRICNKLKLKALFHTTTPPPPPPPADVTSAPDVNPSSDVGPAMVPAQGEATPNDNTAPPDNSEKADFLYQLLSRKRRSAFRIRHRNHDEDDSDEDDYDNDDDDNSWISRGRRYYPNSNGRHHLYNPSSRSRIGALGIRYRNNHRWNSDEDDDDSAYPYGYGHDDSHDDEHDDDRSQYGYNRHQIEYPVYDSEEVDDIYPYQSEFYNHRGSQGGHYGYGGYGYQEPARHGSYPYVGYNQRRMGGSYRSGYRFPGL